MSDENLRKERFRELLEQMRADGYTQERTAAAIGVSQALVSQVLRGVKDGADSLESAKAKLGIDEDFFSRPEAAGMSYREFIGKSPLRETVELDSSASPYPEVEDFIAAEVAAGRPIDPGHLIELRALRWHRATVLSPYESASRILAELRAKDRGKAIHKRRVR